MHIDLDYIVENVFEDNNNIYSLKDVVLFDKMIEAYDIIHFENVFHINNVK